MYSNIDESQKHDAKGKKPKSTTVGFSLSEMVKKRKKVKSVATERSSMVDWD